MKLFPADEAPGLRQPQRVGRRREKNLLRRRLPPASQSRGERIHQVRGDNHGEIRINLIAALYIRHGIAPNLGMETAQALRLTLTRSATRWRLAAKHNARMAIGGFQFRERKSGQGSST